MECKNPIEVLDSLQKDKRVIESSLFGMKIHILISLASEEEASALVSQILSENKIEVIGLQKIVPSLEDVFVSLIREKA